jgi:hypothetical protein
MTSSSELKAKRGDGWPASESRISWSILPGVHLMMAFYLLWTFDAANTVVLGPAARSDT